jgi:hypothetical protein
MGRQSDCPMHRYIPLVGEVSVPREKDTVPFLVHKRLDDFRNIAIRLSDSDWANKSWLLSELNLN